MNNLAWILAALFVGIVVAVNAPGKDTTARQGQRVTNVTNKTSFLRRRIQRQRGTTKSKHRPKMNERTLERVYGPSVLVDSKGSTDQQLK